MNTYNLSEQFVQTFGRKIVQGEIKEGTVLAKLEDLSASYGVSRTVVREAMKGLAARKLVKSVPKLGTIVQPKTEWQWWDEDVLLWAAEADSNQGFLLKLTEIRHAIEPFAAELAAKNASEEDIAKLTEFYCKLEASVSDESKWVEADYDFHNCILQASKNELLINLVELLRKALIQSRKVTISQVNTKKVVTKEEALQFHKDVCDAICNGDQKLAREKMLVLLGKVSEIVISSM